MQDSHLLKLLLTVLRGDFAIVKAGELIDFDSKQYVRDGLCAVPMSAATKKAQPIPADTELLQVASPEAANAFKGGVQDLRSGQSAACYLLSADVQEALNLVGKHEHLWQLLRAHDKHHHADRSLATHVAHVMRQEEGYVLVNAHPGFEDVLALTGIINEPMANERPSVKMVQGYACLLPADDPLLRARGLRQFEHAEEAWRDGILPPVGRRLPPRDASAGPLSEKMVAYMTTRRTYDLEAELTVDYGASYQRSYHSGTHRARSAGSQLYEIPTSEVSADVAAAAHFPVLPGWWNPRQQPQTRPAFRVERGGRVVCVDDLPWLVEMRKRALGLLPPASAAAPSDSSSDTDSSSGSEQTADVPSPRTPSRARPSRPVAAASASNARKAPAAPKKTARRGVASPKTPPRGQPTLSWLGVHATTAECRALEWQCGRCDAFTSPSHVRCTSCGEARPAPETLDAGRRKRAREPEPTESHTAPRKSLFAAFGWMSNKLRA